MGAEIGSTATARNGKSALSTISEKKIYHTSRVFYLGIFAWKKIQEKFFGF